MSPKDENVLAVSVAGEVRVPGERAGSGVMPFMADMTTCTYGRIIRQSAQSRFVEAPKGMSSFLHRSLRRSKYEACRTDTLGFVSESDNSSQ